MLAAWVFVAIATGVSAQSAATQTGLDNAMQACETPLVGLYLSNPTCAQLATTIGTTSSSGSTGMDATTLTSLCKGNCIGPLKTAYQGISTCMLKYKSTLVADLTADNVTNATFIADSMLSAYTSAPQMFDVMCTQNEAGQFCMTMWSQMGADLATNNATDLNAVCDIYFNSGCCLTTLNTLYAAFAPGVDYVSLLAVACPNLQADVNTPPAACVKAGQTATALTVQLPLNGLNCANYATQTPAFKNQVNTALKLDLAAAGLPAADTSIQSISSSGSNCVANVVVRAGSNAATSALTSVAGGLNSASLTNTAVVLATQSGLVSGTVTLGKPTVSQETLTAYGTPAPSAAMALNPSYLVPAAAALLWLA